MKKDTAIGTMKTMQDIMDMLYNHSALIKRIEDVQICDRWPVSPAHIDRSPDGTTLVVYDEEYEKSRRFDAKSLFVTQDELDALKEKHRAEFFADKEKWEREQYERLKAKFEGGQE